MLTSPWTVLHGNVQETEKFRTATLPKPQAPHLVCVVCPTALNKGFSSVPLVYIPAGKTLFHCTYLVVL